MDGRGARRGVFGGAEAASWVGRLLALVAGSVFFRSSLTGPLFSAGLVELSWVLWMGSAGEGTGSNFQDSPGLCL